MQTISDLSDSELPSEDSFLILFIPNEHLNFSEPLSLKTFPFTLTALSPSQNTPDTRLHPCRPACSILFSLLRLLFWTFDSRYLKSSPPAPCSFNVTPASSHSCQMCSLHWQTVQVLRLVIFNGKFIWFGDMDVNMIFMSSTLEPSEKVKTFNNLQSANFKRAIKMCVNGW